MLPRKTTLAIACFGAFSAAVQYAPGLLRPAPPPPAKPAIEVRTVRKPRVAKPVNGPHLTDPSGALYHFYRALAQAEAREAGAKVRILHYGDSPTTADLITGDLRDLLQRRFGDGGHGFVLIGKPWAWYGHRGIDLKGSGWTMNAASQSRIKDYLHGLGGVAFSGGAGANTRITAPAGHRTMEVYFLRQPEGGGFRVLAGEEILAEVETAGETKSSGYALVSLPAGTREVKLEVTEGDVRLFGVSFEKGGPGLVYHSLGLNGASIQMALRSFAAGHWAEQIRHADPDLIVINYGSNESFFGAYLNKLYAEDLRQLLKRLHAAMPEASILVMSPMDRGEVNEEGQIVTPAALPRVIAIQNAVAIEEDCGFFNTYEAMGGEGTMARWYQAKNRLVSADFLHPSPQGAAKVGALVNKALMDSYELWKAEQQP